MAHGRALTEADDEEPVVVVSARLARRLVEEARGGGLEAGERASLEQVLGRVVTLNGQALTVVGVTAPAFQFPSARADAWIPAGTVRQQNPRCCGFTPVLCLKAGASVAAASDEVAALVRGLGEQMPRQLADTRVRVARLSDALVAPVRPALLTLMAAVVLLLVLACANVTNLLLARNTARAHELGVRRALGASRVRLVTDALAEGAVLAGAAGVAGVVLASMLVSALQAAWPDAFPRLEYVRLDGATVLFALTTSTVVTMVLGVLPVLPAGNVQPSLVVSQRSSTSHRGVRLMLRGLSVAQLAVSVVLVVVAVLLGRSLVALAGTDVGIDTRQVATASLGLAMDRALTDAQQVALVDRVLERLSAAPDVVAVGIGAARPPDTSRMALTLNRSDAPEARANYMAAAIPATPGYFQALGIRLERGRLFTDADTLDAPPVVVLSAEAARRLFPEGDAVGQRVQLPVLRDGQTSTEDMTVVGVVSSVKYGGLEQDAGDAVYRPFAQQAWRAVFVAARMTGEPSAFTARVAREVAAVDPEITVSGVATLESVLADITAPPRLRTWMLGALAGAAVLIAAVGLFGVLAYSVSQRRRELGVRMALGADAERIRRMVRREGLWLSGLGAAVGLAGAAGASRLVASLLYATSPTDTASFVLAAAGAVMVGLIASDLPARRAARVNPTEALKAE